MGRRTELDALATWTNNVTLSMSSPSQRRRGCDGSVVDCDDVKATTAVSSIQVACNERDDGDGCTAVV